MYELSVPYSQTRFPNPILTGWNHPLEDTGGTPSETQVGLHQRHRWVFNGDTGGSLSKTQVGLQQGYRPVCKEAQKHPHKGDDRDILMSEERTSRCRTKGELDVMRRENLMSCEGRTWCREGGDKRKRKAQIIRIAPIADSQTNSHHIVQSV